MYKELHIEYANPNNILDTVTLKFKLTNYDITQRWANKVKYSIENYQIDDPTRFYGFDAKYIETQKAVIAINSCIDTINNYKPNFITKRVNEFIDQDTLNYLHHIFEVYHGLLNQPHEFFLNAPVEVQRALAQLNVQVHRCEGLVERTGRKQLPRHIVTWYQLKKEETLELHDYEHFTDFYEFGTVYLLYTEIGKTLQDLTIDNDRYIHENAYRPFRHYSSDFVVRFYGTATQTWKDLRIQYKKHYDENKEFYLKSGYPYDHPYNRPGNIPLAKLMPTHMSVVNELKIRQMVKSVNLI
jgi:hypothetical protein